MTEPDVALTDYALMILCSFFSWRLWFQPGISKLMGRIWVAFFISIAFASLTGGTSHGFFLDPTTLPSQILWLATLLAIGVTASVAWVLVGVLLSGPEKVKVWSLFAGFVFVVYSVIVIFYSQRFVVVILSYLPPMIGLLAVTGYHYFQRRGRQDLWISAGVLVSFAAAFVQQAKIGLHPDYFNHNALYHVIQAFALWMIFMGAKAVKK
ncbi:MAG: hypothetical protein JNM39_10055 [Bdellovibrionaceae bacterium]|nr:hypothetical protein [Pseudobdellovibrionaceae bacterium]